MQISIKNRNYFALSAVSFLHLFAWSAAMSFFAIWLGQHLGIGATKTGLLYSANALAALCMQPVLGFISDKIGLKKTLLFTILIILLLIGPFFIYIYGPLLVSNFYLGAILGGIYLGFIFNAGYGVIDSYINKVSIKYGFEYGRARMWGSFGWAAATYTTGIAMNINPNLAFVSASLAALIAIICLSMAKVEISDVEMKKANSVSLKDIKHLLQNKDFLFLLFFMIGVGCVYDVYDQQFGVYFVSQFESQAEGNRWFRELEAIQTFFEAIFLFVTPVIANKLGAKRTLILAGTIMSIRIIGSSLEWGPLWIAAVKCIHSFEKPLFLVGQFKYISKNFDLRLSASIYLGCLCTSSICASIFSPFFGSMYESIGFSQSYLYIGIVAGICTLISQKLLISDNKRVIDYKEIILAEEKMQEQRNKK